MPRYHLSIYLSISFHLPSRLTHAYVQKLMQNCPLQHVRHLRYMFNGVHVD